MMALPYSWCTAASTTVPLAGQLLAELRHTAVEGIDGGALVGDLRVEGGGVSIDLAQVSPVADERAGDRHHEGEHDAGAHGRRAGKVEPDDPRTVSPHQE